MEKISAKCLFHFRVYVCDIYKDSSRVISYLILNKTKTEI